MFIRISIWNLVFICWRIFFFMVWVIWCVWMVCDWSKVGSICFGWWMLVVGWLIFCCIWCICFWWKCGVIVVLCMDFFFWIWMVWMWSIKVVIFLILKLLVVFLIFIFLLGCCWRLLLISLCVLWVVLWLCYIGCLGFINYVMGIKILLSLRWWW